MQAFFIRLGNYPLYQKLMKAPLTYVTGAVLLAVFQIAHVSLFNSGWGVTSTFATWGAWVYEAVVGSVREWGYFSDAKELKALNQSLLTDGGTLRDIGIVFGALLATLFASEFKIKRIKSIRQVIAAVLGGLLMGYGARLAHGCNIGALFTGISAFSVSGWVFALFLFVGAYLGCKILARFFI